MFSAYHPSFRFLSYDQLRDNFLAFKEDVWARYKGEQYNEIRELIMDIAMRQIKLDMCHSFDEQEKIIALTGMLLEFKNKLPACFDNMNAHSFNLFSCFKRHSWVKECDDMEGRLYRAVGIEANNLLDENGKYAIFTVMKKFKSWEADESAARAYSL